MSMRNSTYASVTVDAIAYNIGVVLATKDVPIWLAEVPAAADTLKHAGVNTAGLSIVNVNPVATGTCPAGSVNGVQLAGIGLGWFHRP